MTQMIHPRRGRPKGSGIDDRPKLREIAAIIANQPEIRPTTAIKLLGENDPSVIRRLRDKFHAMQGELMAEMRRPAPPNEKPVAERKETAAAPTVAPVTPVPLPAKAAAPLVQHELAQLADATAATLASIAETTIETAFQKTISEAGSITDTHAARMADIQRKMRLNQAEDWPDPNSSPYDTLVGLTIEATVNAIEQQMRICEQVFKIPTVAMMVRNQIAVSEALMNIACSAMRANRSLAAAAA
jgi:hypothetical protein